MTSRLNIFAGLLLVAVLALASGCGGPSSRVITTPETADLPAWQRPYQIDGQNHRPMTDHAGYSAQGTASWYGKKFHGRKTSNGETYDMYAMTAAHKTLPLGVYVQVTNLRNQRQAVVRVNDRGPFVKGRIIDLSYAAAHKLNMAKAGTAPVRVEALGYKKAGDAAGGGYELVSREAAGPFAVQVGAFQKRSNALNLKSRLQGSYGPVRLQTARVEGRHFWRVWVGEYPQLDKAKQARRRLARRGYPQGFVLALP